MTTDPLTNFISVRGTELSAADTREQYRQKIARITLDSIVQIVGLLDAQGTVLEINQVALDAVGINLSEVEGRPFWTTFWWQVSEEINATLREMIRRASQGEFVRWDTEIYGRAGGKETIVIDASLVPIKDDKGEVVFIAAEGRDITAKKAYEREIARQREELAKLDELKTKFFANISHEFRTPLTLMMGPLEDALAQPEELPDSTREGLELASRNSVRLLKLVNTLLDFSRIEAGRIEASFEPVDLAMLTAEFASVFRSVIERAGLRFVIDCPPLPEQVYVDREMWEKVVFNFLSNAFTFTFEGEIEVSLRAAGSGAEIIVRDTGTGIPANEIPQLFERFHRVQGARGRTYEGSGIGLALVQELVKLHGGDVRVESEVNQGSKFIATIPFGKNHLPAERIQGARTITSTGLRGEAYVQEALRWFSEPPSAGDDFPRSLNEGDASPQKQANVQDFRSRVLLADDNADMRAYVQRLLSDQYDVVAVGDGESALKIARERRPDLIISDIMMPGMDGFALLRAIRADNILKPVPVILLSARAGEESRVEGLNEGADDYLVKPFSARELMARVRSHLTMAGVRREADQATGLLASIVESSDDAIISKTLDGIILSWNKGAEHLFGYTANEAIGQPITMIIPVNRLDEEPGIIKSLKAGKRVDHFETVRKRKDGSLVEISLTISPLRDIDGNIIGASKVARDISHRKLSDRSLAEQARLLDLSNDAIIIRDLQDRITYWNKGASELYDYSREEAVGQVIHNLFQTSFPDEFSRIAGHLQRHDRWTGELTHKRKDGSTIVVSSRWALARDSEGNPVSILETNNDITRQKLNQQALLESEQRFRTLAEQLEEKVHDRTSELERRNAEVFDLSMRLLRTQDDERRHIARELHDTAGQTMTVVGMKIQRLIQKAKQGDPQVESEAENIRGLVEKLNQDIRTTSYLLHPPLLDESGLAAALAWYVRGLAERAGLDIKLSVSENLGRLPQNMELVVFRLIQECLTNIHRHSGSKTAVIRLARTANSILVEVADQGSGMTPQRLAEVQSQGTGVGVRGMRERIRQFAGEMKITSDNSGTTITFTFPIPAMASAQLRNEAAAN